MTIRDMEKYYNEKGEVGVLISPGWGASWSTWYDNYAIAFDKRIIEYWLHNNPSENEMKYFLNSIGNKLSNGLFIYFLRTPPAVKIYVKLLFKE